MHLKRIPLLKILRIATTLAGIVIMIIAMTTTTRVPLHQRVLVQGIGIDKGSDDQFHVTVQAVSTSAAASVEVYQTDGDSVYDALNNITLVSGKTPFYTHNSIIIIGQTCAEDGLEEIMDFFVRYHQTRPAENVFMADKKAEDILTLKSDLQISMEDQQLQTNQYVMASQIEQLASAGNLNSQLLEIHVLDVANALYNDACDVYLPVLSTKDKEINVEGCAVFSGDKLQTVLDRSATVGVKAINNKLTGGAVTVELENDDTATLSFVESDCKIQSEIRDGVPHFTLSLSCEMNIDEITRPLRNQLSVEDFATLQDAASEKIKSVVEDTLQKTLQQEQVDVVCFSNTLLRQQTKWWKQHQQQWRELIPQCTYTVTVETAITGEGQEMSPQTIEPIFRS